MEHNLAASYQFSPRFTSIKTPVDAASLLLDIASSKGTRPSEGNRAKDSDVVSTPQHLNGFFRIRRRVWTKAMRKSAYQSSGALSGSQAFLHGSRFEAIPPDGMASCKMLGSSHIECVTRLKNILVDRASTRTSLHDASLGTRVNVNGFSFFILLVPFAPGL
jgi:hypothetical protein